MKNLIFLIAAIIFFVLNLATLLLIGWGFCYPKYDIVILLHFILMALSFIAIGFELGELP